MSAAMQRILSYGIKLEIIQLVFACGMVCGYIVMAVLMTSEKALSSLLRLVT